MLRRSIAVLLLSAGLATVGTAQGAAVARSADPRTDVQKELQQVRQELRELRTLVQKLATSMQQEGQRPAAGGMGGMARGAGPTKAAAAEKAADKPVARRTMTLGGGAAAPVAGGEVEGRVVEGRPGGMAVVAPKPPKAPKAPKAPEAPKPARIAAPSEGGVWVLEDGKGEAPGKARFELKTGGNDKFTVLSPGGKAGQIYTTGKDGSVRVWTTDGKAGKAATPEPQARSGGCCCCCCCQCCGNKAQQAPAPASTRTLFVAPEEVRSRAVRGMVLSPEGKQVDGVKVLRLQQGDDDDDDDDDAPAAPKQIRVRKVEAPSTTSKPGTTSKQRLINV